MKSSASFILLVLLLIPAAIVNGQKIHSNIQKITCPDNVETTVCKAIYFDVSPPLIEMAKVKTVIKKRKEKDQFEDFPNPKYDIYGHLPFTLAEDPVWQKQDGTYLPQTIGPIQNFEGVGNLDGVMPPDTQGDVSNDKYLQVVNSRYAIYSKTGTVILAGTPLSTIWSGIPAPYNGTNDGDPIVLWDQAAQRWIISQFSLPTTSQNAELVAISATSDPSGSWYRYVFLFGNQMPDYPKLGVWPDGYYLSFNQFANQSTSNGTGACALERAKMLNGDQSAQMVYKNLGASADPFSMLPSDWDGVTSPPAGEPNYFMYFNDWSSGGPYLRIWSFHVDWTTPSSSTFAQTFSLTPATFNSTICSGVSRGRCIPEPGGTSASYKLEDLADRMMYRNQYRNFGSYQTMVDCHTVNTGSGVAGCRWYELRNTGSGWSIYQQGTYSPDAVYRWVPSVAMNGNGDIALGYSVSDGTSVYPGIRFTGRRAIDPLGSMTVTEQTIISGSGSQNYSAYGRWGDYSMMSVDPSDDQTFWFTSEYVQTTGTFNWQTRIASFKFSNNPVVTTTAATAITGTTATLNGTVNPNGLATNYHFEYGTTVSYGSSTTIASAGSGTSTINVNAGITGLSAGTTYHFRLVGVNSDGTSNGNDMTFTYGAAVITTTAATSIAVTTATSGGNVTSDGGSTVTARGVCWGTSANPIVSGNHTTDGTGTGSFTSSLTGLSASTLYHIRAYATNGNGTFYGDDQTFTTLCGSYSLPFTESFSTTSIPACWTQVDNQGNGQIWQFGVITDQSPNPALTGNYAFLNSDDYGNGNSQNADLITPLLNLSSYSTVNLAFNHYFLYYSGSSGKVSYSINNGATWTTIATFSSTSSLNPTAFSQAVNAVAGQAQVKFKWNYTGTWGYYWAIDDVNITGSCTPVPVSVSIGASSNPVCAGASVTFTASPVNGGTTPTYQWKVNGSSIGGATNTTYSYVPLNNDQVTCVLTSNAACTSGNPATSNTIAMTVNPILPVSVSIGASANPVCSGTSVTFTATPTNGGTTPAYQWKVNGTSVGGATNTTYSYAPANGDQVTCILTSNFTCKSGSPATSNTIAMTVNPILPVSVSIGASANPVCAGTSVTFTATPVNGGASPAYQWKVNGTSVGGATNTTYSYVPANGDQVTCLLTSNALCPSGNPATSNTIAMTVNPILPVSVSIGASANPVCAGTSVTFTATPTNGGTTPAYQWKVNGASVGGATNTTYSYAPANGDQVTCVLTSNLTCKSGSPATSNTIAMTVNPILPVSVSIGASANPVCAGTNVTFTATPTNGGASPAYQWRVNGASIGGATNTTYSYVPINNDLVTCVLTSNAICPSGNPATSNIITMTVNPLLPVSVSIGASANPVLTGTTVNFKAFPVNEGSSPQYQWKVNGLNVGTNNQLFSYVPLNNDVVSCLMLSSLTCVSGNPAMSNSIIMTVTIVPYDLTVQNDTITNGHTRCYDATNTIIVAGNGTTFIVQSGGSATLIAGQKISYLPGTNVNSGGYMWGYIAPSGPFCVTPSMPAVVESEDLIPLSTQHSFFTIYPNPTTGNFILELKGDIPFGDVSIRIYGMRGETILTKVLNGENKHEFSLSDKPVGVYFIHVITGDKAETVKIIKL